jgi:hypothetical protein
MKKIISLIILYITYFTSYSQITGNIVNIKDCNSKGSISTGIKGGTPPYFFLWSNGATTANLKDIAAGKYCLTVTDDFCCQASTCFGVKNETLLSVPLIWEIVPATSCAVADGKVNALFTGSNPAGLNFEWFWLRNLQYVSLGQNGAPPTSMQQTNLATGNYKVVLTDASGCTGEEHFKITAPDEIKAVIDGVSPCKGSKNGSIKVDIEYPIANYDIIITGPSSQQHIAKGTSGTIYTNLEQGYYTILIQKSGNPDFCTKMLSYELKEDVFLASDIKATVINNCSWGESKGKISLNDYKFGTDYKVLWSFNNSTNINQTNLANGKYTVNVTNQCGKQAQQTFEVKEVGNLIVTQTKSLTCGSTLTATLPNGVEPITYIWNSGEITQTINNIGSGRYNVQAEDAGGCKSSSGAILPEDPSIYTVTITDQPCKDAIGSGKAIITIKNPNDDVKVTWENTPIPLVKSTSSPDRIGIIDGLNSWELIRLKIKIGDCILRTQLETSGKNTSEEFVKYDKKTELCETKTMCNGNLVKTNKEAPYPGFSHGDWFEKCEQDLFCKGKLEKVATKKYPKYTVKLGKYIMIIAAAYQVGFIDEPTYNFRLSQFEKKGIDSYCNKVRYCSAPGADGFKYWEAPFAGQGINALATNTKLGKIDGTTTPSCYEITCPEILFPNDEFCLKDILPNYMKDYFDANPNVKIPVLTSIYCKEQRTHPFYQIILWENDIWSAYNNYNDNTQLAKMIEKYKNDPRAHCAFVTFCLSDFSVSNLDIEQVICDEVTVPTSNGTFQDFETCKLDCNSCNDPIAYCNNKGTLSTIKFNPNFPGKNNFKISSSNGSNSLNPLENIKFSSNEPSTLKNFSISRDLDRKVVNGLTIGKDKNLFLDYRFDAYDKRELETPNITHFLDDYTDDFWIATEQVDSNTIALNYEKDANVDWTKIITAKDYLQIKNLHEEAGIISISGTFNGTLLVDGKVVSESNKGGTFVLRYNHEGNIISNNVIENMDNGFIAENLSGNTYLTGISSGELKSDNQQLSTNSSSAGALSQIVYDKHGKIIKTITNAELSKGLIFLTAKTSSDGTQTIYVLKGQGDVIIKQKSIVSSLSQDNITLISFDNNGNLNWHSSFDGLNVDTKHISISFGTKNTLYLGLTFKNKFNYKKSFYTSNGKNDIIVILLDNYGNVTNTKQFGSKDDENISQLMSDDKGVLYLGGEYDGLTRNRIIGNHQFVNAFKTSFSQAYVSYVLESDFYQEGVINKSIKQDYSQNSGLIAYPNPFTNGISIEINTDKGQNCVLSLQTITGVKVYSQPYSLEKGANKIEIASLDKLLSGIYIIEVKTDNGQILTDRIVKMD